MRRDFVAGAHHITVNDLSPIVQVPALLTSINSKESRETKTRSFASSQVNTMQFLCLNIASAIIFLILGITHALFTPPNNETIPAVIVFGDSIVDPGNNNHITTLIKANFHPYGKDLNGGKPTGRFSNGRIPSDLIVEELGLKELVPAYLDPNLQIEDLLTGVSFASGGSGYDPLTPKIVSVLSLWDQLKLFKKYVRRVKAAVGEERTKTILSKSVFIVCIGSDDIANTYFATPFRRFNYDVPSYTDLMLRSASRFFKDLYHLGARRIGVLSVPPIGCVPSQRTLGGGFLRECANISNHAALLFNSKLSSRLDSFNDKFTDAKFIYVDTYAPLLHLFLNPESYGFEVGNKGCCGTGNIEASILCNQLSPTCTNDSKYVFWDSYHPTERAYYTLRPLLPKYLSKFF